MARNYRHFIYDRNQRFIYPTSDWGFKYMFGTEANKDLLLGVLKELLPDLGIESVEFLPRDITIPIGKLKEARFDIYCKLKDGKRVVIEMQNYVGNAFIDRSLIYTSAAILEHHVNSDLKGYRLNPTVFLAFLGDPLFPDVKRTPVRLALCDIDEPVTTIRSNNLLQIFVELPKFEGSLNTVDENTPFVEKLAHVLMEMADCKEIPSNLNDPILEKLFIAADTSSMDTNMKENYMKSILGEFEYNANIEEAREEAIEKGREQGREEGREQGREEGRKEGRAEGREEGRAEGREEGRAEGREKGLAEGLAEGREKAKIEIAKALRDSGVDGDVIYKTTGIKPENL